jgi:hypothetical protein
MKPRGESDAASADGGGADLDASKDATADDGGPDADAGDSSEACAVPEDRTTQTCTQAATDQPFSPRVKWRFPPPSLELKEASAPGVPLVANLTDDNGDGRIDLCDMPDVLLATGGGSKGAALWLLSGDTGRVHTLMGEPILPGSVPAIADLDSDGVPEIVAITASGTLAALNPDGEVLWRGATVKRPTGVLATCWALSIYDLEGDGSPEILAGFQVFDASGAPRFGANTDLIGVVLPLFEGCIAPIAADLDGDGLLEVLFGHETYHADGMRYWGHQPQTASVPTVANLDDDPELEVLLSTAENLVVFEHDGTARTTLAHTCGGSALSVHDFDGDGRDELALPNCYGAGRARVFTLEPSGLAERLNLLDPLDNGAFSGLAAFDLAGHKQAALVYVDPAASAVYAGAAGGLLFEGTRTTGGAQGTPVIADVDKDGSADLLLGAYEADGAALLTVVSEKDGRWMPARRIWNQFAYHVTNIHEDGRVPKGPSDAPQLPVRMRTNAQLDENGKLCLP